MDGFLWGLKAKVIVIHSFSSNTHAGGGGLEQCR